MVESSQNDQTKSLVDALKSRDQRTRSQAFEDIYVHNFPIIEKYVLANGGISAEAKDIFQDGIAILYAQLIKDKFRGESSINTYLFSICRNLWFKEIKKNKKSNQMKKDHAQDTDQYVDEPLESDKTLAVFKLFNTLEKDCQKVLELFYFEKLSMTEIAQEFGFKGEQSAKNKKSKCLKRLRALIQQNPSVYSQFQNL
ncbi:MAG: sigma-70 family RNA polymerase sigma factor [Bacteroidota bacterium]